MFTTDSAGEFTRGMELLARAQDDAGVSSRAAPVQDDYLMKLLATRPAALPPTVQHPGKQPAAAVAALPASVRRRRLSICWRQGLAAARILFVGGVQRCREDGAGQ